MSERPPPVDWDALRCRRCGAEARADVATAARYFREGWPICCGMTMDAKDAGAERVG